MVEWTDNERAIIQGVFDNLDYDTAGAEALSRCLIVYPWTMRYFGSFGNLYNAEAIRTNPKIAAHGIVVVRALDQGLKNMDNIKDTYAALSKKHSEELKIDPDNFRLFSDILTIVVASKMGKKFTADTQAALQKFLSVVVFALSAKYV